MPKCRGFIVAGEHDQMVGPLARHSFQRLKERICQSGAAVVEMESMCCVDDGWPARFAIPQGQSGEKSGDRGMHMDDVVTALTDDFLNAAHRRETVTATARPTDLVPLVESRRA